jgi:hypothetical protein
VIDMWVVEVHVVVYRRLRCRCFLLMEFLLVVRRLSEYIAGERKLVPSAGWLMSICSGSDAEFRFVIDATSCNHRHNSCCRRDWHMWQSCLQIDNLVRIRWSGCRRIIRMQRSRKAIKSSDQEHYPFTIRAYTAEAFFFWNCVK